MSLEVKMQKCNTNTYESSYGQAHRPCKVNTHSSREGAVLDSSEFLNMTCSNLYIPKQNIPGVGHNPNAVILHDSKSDYPSRGKLSY